jgi:hypothetical protein
MAAVAMLISLKDFDLVVNALSMSLVGSALDTVIFCRKLIYADQSSPN